MKRAEAGVVLRSGLAQLDVLADDADDVGLLLDGLCEVVGHGRYGQSIRLRKVAWRAAVTTQNTRESCGDSAGLFMDYERTNFRNKQNLPGRGVSICLELSE